MKTNRKIIKPVSRKEDMSPRGQIKIFEDADGDIVVSIFNDDGCGDIEYVASVEFCTCGMGGGQSQNTRDALINLAEAMEKDNKEHPARKGDL